MQSLKIWFVSGWIHILLGAAIMFIIIRRPQWIKDAEARVVAWSKKKLGMS
jgi:uncharacterized membrane protein